MSKGLKGSAAALEALAKASLWVLDVDGVLLDPKPSFYRAAIETAIEVASLATGSGSLLLDENDIAAFKGAGGWNDDFDLATGLAWALVEKHSSGKPVHESGALAVGGLPVLLEQLNATLSESLLAAARTHCEPAFVRVRCAARYSGRDRCRAMYGIDPALHPSVSVDGLWRLESILCDAKRLREWHLPLAYLTGRNKAETQLASERLSLEIPAERWIVDDGVCAKKPSPEGLFRLAAHAKEMMLFVGDTVDDQNAALAYRKASTGGPQVVFARVVGPGAVHASVDGAFAEGADIVVNGLDDLMNFISKGGSQ